MKDIPFDSLLVLIAVAESKNFYEAADRVGITQASVSLKMKDLEMRLPIPVFQLDGKRKVLTHYGRSLYEIALNKKNDWEKDLEGLHRNYAKAELLTLRVGGRSEVLEFLAPYFDFAGRIELVNLNSTEAVKKLLVHEVDIALSYIQPDSTEVIAKKLFQSAAHFVVHEKFLKNRNLTLDWTRKSHFLTETPCILYQRDGHLLKEWLKHVKLPMDQLKVRYIAEDWRSVQNLVDQGLGYAIVPAYIKSYSKNVQSLELPTQVLPKLTFFALYEKGLKKIGPFKNVLEFSEILRHLQ